MKPTRLLLTLLGFSVSSLLAAPEQPVAPDSLEAAFAKGKFSFNARLRYEYADQSNLRESNAFTLRSRFGFTTAPVAGLQGMIEGENIAILNDPDDYNASGTNPGGAGRTAIGDPDVTDVNQAWLSYTLADTMLRAGRQRIVLDNARFVGDVGWRQNAQTFDAATLTAKPTKTFTAFYGYVSKVSRVFGNKSPQPDFDSDSHLVNLAYSGLPGGTLTAYAYLLDFKNSAANSSDTFGASFAGATPLAKDFKLTYHFEAATQRDAGNNPLAYSARYYVAELGGLIAPFDFGAGYEVLGSDNGKKGFATPLATLHAFNGWADLFLATPARGLRDSYASVGVTIPGGYPLKVVYHSFRSDVASQNYGNEWDAQLAHKIGKAWTLLAKYARYDGKPPFFDTEKIWVQTEYNF
ncbi:MAG TPA: alginate export family protein [Opitutaceae bacterium]|nr:alginate export family protein [Opitutaceae bacterium]